MSRSALSSDIQELEILHPGMPLVFDGNKVTYVSESLASSYKKGDSIRILGEMVIREIH